MRKYLNANALLFSITLLLVPLKSTQAFSSIAGATTSKSLQHNHNSNRNRNSNSNSNSNSNRNRNNNRHLVVRRKMVQGVVVDGDNCLVNTNPATGEIISRVRCTTPGELGELVDTARASQREWRTKSVHDRVALLKTCIDELAAVSDPMIELIVREMGKPIGEAREEVEFAVVDQDEYFGILLESLGPKTYGKSTVVRHPYGVVAIMR